MDVSTICPDCMDSVNKQYLFKEKLKKVIKMPAPKHTEILRKVHNFLSKTDEKILVMNHLGILSVVPESRSTVIDSLNFINPVVKLTRVDPEKVNIKEMTNNAIIQPQFSRAKEKYYNDDTDGLTDGDDCDKDDDYGKSKTKKRKASSPKGRPSKKPKISNNFEFVSKRS